MDVLIPVLVVIVVVGVVVWGVYIARVRAAADKSESVLATLAIPDGTVLRLTRDELIEGYAEQAQRHPVAGLVARVEEGGTVNRRFTVTRIVALGVFAAGVPKKIDDRQLYLTIEGPTTVIVHVIPVAKSKTITAAAREFAAKVNQMSGAPAAAGPVDQPALQRPTAPATSQVPPAPSSALSEQIRQLAQLRDEGLITAEEYETKKADLLSRF